MWYDAEPKTTDAEPALRWRWRQGLRYFIGIGFKLVESLAFHHFAVETRLFHGLKPVEVPSRRSRAHGGDVHEGGDSSLSTMCHWKLVARSVAHWGHTHQ